MTPLGIDVSKKTLDVCLRLDEQSCLEIQVKNSTRGYQHLLSWLQTHTTEKLQVCLEATNIYSEKVATFLHQHGYSVSVVNPWQIKAYRQSQLKRHKNDKEDARLLAHFCATQNPPLWHPPTEAEKTLQALVRHLERLKDEQQRLKNQLETAQQVPVKASLKNMIAHFQQEICTIQQAIRTHIDKHPDLKQKQELLKSIPGIGEQTATALLAEMPDMGTYPSAKQVAADVGLIPAENRSGSSVHKRPTLSKMGNRRVRKLLYFPAISATRYNPIVQAFYERLLQRGKPKMVALVAAMRKLLHIAYGVLKHQQPFNPVIET